MIRIRLRTGRGALFLAMFAIALLAFLPLRLALGWAGVAAQGVAARSVSGTVWSGSLREARVGVVALGDLSASVAPLPLVAGRARILMRDAGAADSPAISGALVLSRHRIGIDSVEARISGADAFAPLPIDTIDLSAVTVSFLDGDCDHAEGRVRLTLAASPLPLPTTMAGAARCEGGALLLPLAGAPGESAQLRLWADGRYRAELTLPPGDAAGAPAMAAAGFTATAGGWRLSAEGRF